MRNLGLATLLLVLTSLVIGCGGGGGTPGAGGGGDIPDDFGPQEIRGIVVAPDGMEPAKVVTMQGECDLDQDGRFSLVLPNGGSTMGIAVNKGGKPLLLGILGGEQTQAPRPAATSAAAPALDADLMPAAQWQEWYIDARSTAEVMLFVALGGFTLPQECWVELQSYINGCPQTEQLAGQVATALQAGGGSLESAAPALADPVLAASQAIIGTVAAVGGIGADAGTMTPAAVAAIMIDPSTPQSGLEVLHLGDAARRTLQAVNHWRRRAYAYVRWKHDTYYTDEDQIGEYHRRLPDMADPFHEEALDPAAQLKDPIQTIIRHYTEGITPFVASKSQRWVFTRDRYTEPDPTWPDSAFIESVYDVAIVGASMKSWVPFLTEVEDTSPDTGYYNIPRGAMDKQEKMNFETYYWDMAVPLITYALTGASAADVSFTPNMQEFAAILEGGTINYSQPPKQVLLDMLAAIINNAEYTLGKRISTAVKPLIVANVICAAGDLGAVTYAIAKGNPIDIWEVKFKPVDFRLSPENPIIPVFGQVSMQANGVTAADGADEFRWEWTPDLLYLLNSKPTAETRTPERSEKEQGATSGPVAQVSSWDQTGTCELSCTAIREDDPTWRPRAKTTVRVVPVKATLVGQTSMVEQREYELQAGVDWDLPPAEAVELGDCESQMDVPFYFWSHTNTSADCGFVTEDGSFEPTASAFVDQVPAGNAEITYGVGELTEDDEDTIIVEVMVTAGDDWALVARTNLKVTLSVEAGLEVTIVGPDTVDEFEKAQYSLHVAGLEDIPPNSTVRYGWNHLNEPAAGFWEFKQGSWQLTDFILEAESGAVEYEVGAIAADTSDKIEGAVRIDYPNAGSELFVEEFDVVLKNRDLEVAISGPSEVTEYDTTEFAAQVDLAEKTLPDYSHVTYNWTHENGDAARIRPAGDEGAEWGDTAEDTDRIQYIANTITADTTDKLTCTATITYDDYEVEDEVVGEYEVTLKNRGLTLEITGPETVREYDLATFHAEVKWADKALPPLDQVTYTWSHTNHDVADLKDGWSDAGQWTDQVSAGFVDYRVYGLSADDSDTIKCTATVRFEGSDGPEEVKAEAEVALKDRPLILKITGPQTVWKYRTETFDANVEWADKELPALDSVEFAWSHTNHEAADLTCDSLGNVDYQWRDQDSGRPFVAYAALNIESDVGDTLKCAATVSFPAIDASDTASAQVELTLKNREPKVVIQGPEDVDEYDTQTFSASLDWGGGEAPEWIEEDYSWFLPNFEPADIKDPKAGEDGWDDRVDNADSVLYRVGTIGSDQTDTLDCEATVKFDYFLDRLTVDAQRDITLNNRDIIVTIIGPPSVIECDTKQFTAQVDFAAKALPDGFTVTNYEWTHKDGAPAAFIVGDDRLAAVGGAAGAATVSYEVQNIDGNGDDTLQCKATVSPPEWAGGDEVVTGRHQVALLNVPGVFPGTLQARWRYKPWEEPDDEGRRGFQWYIGPEFVTLPDAVKYEVKCKNFIDPVYHGDCMDPGVGYIGPDWGSRRIEWDEVPDENVWLSLTGGSVGRAGDGTQEQVISDNLERFTGISIKVTVLEWQVGALLQDWMPGSAANETGGYLSRVPWLVELLPFLDAPWATQSRSRRPLVLEG